MEKIRNIILLMLTLCAATAAAQTADKVLTGRVKDVDDNGVWRATVMLTQPADSTYKALALTDENGAFTISGVGRGDYHVKITSLGYDDYEKDLTVSLDSTDIGTIRMKDMSTMLEGVTVMAKYTDTRATGETVVRVKGNPLARGRSMLNFMRMLRDIEISGDAISVRGNQGAASIYINDMPSSMQQLKTIPPSMIARIEIDPKANPEYGNNPNGVIKVYLREEAGVIASVEFTGGTNKYGLDRAEPILNLIYSKGKFTLFQSFQATPYYHFKSDYLSKEERSGVQSETYYKSINWNRNLHEGLGMKYKFNKTDALEAKYDFTYTYGSKQEGTSINTIFDSQTTNILHTLNRARQQNHQAMITLRKGFGHDMKHRLIMRTAYGKNKSTARQSYDYNGTKEPALQRSEKDFLSIYPMMILDFGSNRKLSVELNYVNTFNRFRDDGTPTLGYLADGRYDLRSQNYVARSTFTMFPAKNLYIMAQIMYTGVDNKYKNHLNRNYDVRQWEQGVYPYLFAKWTINQEKMRYLNMSFQQSYNLPNYFFLVPTVTWQNQNEYSIGNPNLKRENIYMANVIFSLNRNIAAGYNFNYTDNAMNVVMRQDADRPGVYFTRPENTGHKMRHRLQLQYAGNILKFWNTNTSVSAQYYEEKSPIRNLHYTSVSFSTYNNFSVYKTFGLSLGFWATSKQRNISYDANASYSVNMGAYASLFKDRLSLDLSYNNIFYARRKIKVFGEGWQRIQKELSSASSMIYLTAVWTFTAGKKITDKQAPASMSTQEPQVPTL